MPNSQNYVVLKQVPKKAQMKTLKSHFDKNDLLFISMKKKGEAIAFLKNEASEQKYLQKRHLFLGERKVKLISKEQLEATQKSSEGGGGDGKTPKMNTKKQIIKAKFPRLPKEDLIEEIKETGRLFIRNLNYDVTEEDLLKLFSPFGAIEEIKIQMDAALKQSKGMAFVTFALTGDAVKAFEALDNTEFRERRLHVLPGIEPPSSTPSAALSNPSASSNDVTNKATQFQRAKLERQKRELDRAHNWNALFVNATAVSEFVARQFDQDVSQLHTEHGQQQLLRAAASSSSKGGGGGAAPPTSSMAVLLAWAETQLVLLVKQFLEEHGVRLDQLDALSRGITEVTGGARHRSQALMSAALPGGLHLTSRCFLVKNLPFNVAEPQLRNFLNNLATAGGAEGDKKEGGMPGLQRVIVPPCGLTAILVFQSVAEAKRAYSLLGFSLFQENLIRVQWAPMELLDESVTASISVPTESASANQKADNDADDAAMETQSGHPQEEEKKETDVQATRKILVKNVSFQAQLSELRQLFRPFKGVLAVRMPSKVQGKRGFAFVEFDCEENARVLMDTMGQSTHFLGRRLHMEFCRE